MAARSALLNVMCQAAEKAGRSLIRDFGEVEQLQVSRKGPSDFVSNADLKAEKILKQELSKARPRYGFMLEEGGETTGEEGAPRFIIDPLDGTTNFLHGLPHWAISIAAEQEGTILAGVVYDPIKDEMFWAENGKGAFMNHRRLRVSGRRDLGECIFATGIPFRGLEDRHEPFLKTLQPIMKHSAGVRRFGAAALDLAYVAMGRYDGFWEIGLQPWDMAAGILIAQEAGAKVTEVNGGSNPLFNGTVLTANEVVRAKLEKLFKEA